MEQITLNMIPKGITPVCHASQYDKGRVIRLNIMDGLQGYVLSNESVQLNVRKPDMNIVTTDVDTTSGNTFVDIVTTEQMTACEGDNLCEIVLSAGDMVIASLNFIMRVEVDVLKDGIESETEIHNLETQIADINAELVPALVSDEVANQYDSSNVIFDETPTENHGIGYAVTSEGVANAVDGAKQYTDDEISALTIPENIGDLGDVTVTTPTNGEILVYNNGVFENQANPASTVNFAPDYDDTATYNAPDKVIYQGLLYTANDDNITGAWDSTKWDLTPVSALTGENTPLTTNPADGTVSEAIGEVNDNKADKSALTWTLLGETTGTAEQMLPSDWNELQIYGMFGGNAQYGFTAHAIKAHWGSNPARYIEGGADKDSGTDHHIAVWHIGSNAKIGLDFWRYNNTDYTTTSKLIVYYR